MNWHYIVFEVASEYQASKCISDGVECQSNWGLAFRLVGPVLESVPALVSLQVK